MMLEQCITIDFTNPSKVYPSLQVTKTVVPTKALVVFRRTLAEANDEQTSAEMNSKEIINKTAIALLSSFPRMEI